VYFGHKGDDNRPLKPLCDILKKFLRRAIEKISLRKIQKEKYQNNPANNQAFLPLGRDKILKSMRKQAIVNMATPHSFFFNRLFFDPIGR
jgi:hypothetical protein